MKKREWFIWMLIICISCLAFFFFFNKIIKERDRLVYVLKENNQQLSYSDYEIQYLMKITESGFLENDKPVKISDINYFSVKDGAKSTEQKISSLISSGKKKLIIRYTEIGCNSCADSTFKILAGHYNKLSNYNILLFVDFSNIDAYLKWKKVAEIDYPVYIVNKGEFPFKIEKGNSSYIFTADKAGSANNFFIPDSQFPKLIDKYFAALENK